MDEKRRPLPLNPDGVDFDADLYKAEVIAFVTKKQVVQQFHQIFLRGIG